MLYTALGGIKGATFCSALQLSHRFKMLSWSYNGGFFGNYLCVGKMVASIAQGQALCSIGKAATSVLPPLTTLSLFSKMNIAFTQVALVARPCAPAAQRDEDSSSSRSRLAKSYGRLAPLSLKQDCFFRVPLSKLKCLVQFAFGGQRDFRPPINSPKAPFRQLSKVADASQPL